MVALAQSMPMITPKLLKEFREDYETVRAGIHSAEISIRAEDAFRRAQEDMRRTNQTRLDVARALKRMHDTDSWRDSYDSWDELLRSLKVTKGMSVRLMSLWDDLPPLYDELVPEGQEPVGQVSYGKFAELVEALDAAPQSVPKDEMPKRQKIANIVPVLKRNLTTLRDLCGRLGIADAARTHIDALVALIETQQVG